MINKIIASYRKLTVLKAYRYKIVFDSTQTRKNIINPLLFCLV